MAMHTDLQIYKVSLGLLQMATHLTRNIPRDLKQSLGKRVIDECIDVLRSIESPSECWHQSTLLTELFGDEWHYPLDGKAVEENHKFTYLRRVVEAVQAALGKEQQKIS